MEVEKDYSHLKAYSAEDVRRLKEVMKEGCVVLQEIQDLNEGLSETVKAIAEEIGIPAGQLKKAIKIAHKNSLDEERAKFEEIEDILQNAGRA